MQERATQVEAAVERRRARPGRVRVETDPEPVGTARQGEGVLGAGRKETQAEIARLDDEKKKAREEFEKALRQTYEQDFLASYTLYLRALYPTKIESGAIDQLLGSKRQQ